jgi:uncharacterized iron-regulated membrane protein
MQVRKFHRILGLVLFLFLLNVAITGVMRAHAKALYWTDRPSSEKIELAAPKLDPEKAFEVFKNEFGKDAVINRFELRSFAGKSFYLVEGESAGKKKTLVDATTGEIASPVKEADVILAAKNYVDEKTNFVVHQPSPFKYKRIGPAQLVWRVRFEDNLNTEIIIDPQTGDVLSVLDNGRRFAMWVARLHELDFLNAGKWFLLVLGAAILSLSFAGLFLSLPAKKVKV